MTSSAAEDVPELHPDYCWSHNVIEPSTPGVFRVCFECNHLYQTREDVLRAMRDEWPSNTYRLGEDGLPFSCPYCIHDW